MPLPEFAEKIPNMSSLLKENIMLITQMFDNRVKAFIKNILLKSGFEHYAHRIEYQIRGMPHVHGVVWFKIEVIKDFIDDSGSFVYNKKLIAFIDKWISCSLENEDQRLNDIVKTVNCHKHTKSCKKYGTYCRFDFPRLPSDETLLASPLSEDISDEEKKERLEEAKSILSKVKENAMGMHSRLEQLTV